MERWVRKMPIGRLQGDSELPFGAFFSVFFEFTIFIKIDWIFKTDKEEMKMGTKKSVFILLGVFFFMAGFLGSAKEVGAETLKLKVSNVVTKSEVFPVGNVEEFSIFFVVREGVFVLENGEFGSFKAVVTSEWTKGKGHLFLGYIMFIFVDGSTIVGTFQTGKAWPDPEGKVGGIQKASGELTNGSGRFKGIKGTQSMTGKFLKPLKGESAGKAYIEFILTYTLSP